MHFLQIDINNHGQFDGHFAFQIKTAYLLSDVTNIIGPSTFLITFDHVAKNLTVPQICVIVVRDAENQDPALIGVIEKYLKRKVKRKELEEKMVSGNLLGPTHADHKTKPKKKN